MVQMHRLFRSMMLSIMASAMIAMPAFSIQSLPEIDTSPGRGFFIENVGQFPGAGRFVLPGNQGYIWAASDGMWITRFAVEQPPTDPGKLAGEIEYTGGVHLQLSFANSNPSAALIPFGRIDTHVSYLKGADSSQWHTDVPVWSGLRYIDLYPAIDLVVETDESGMLNWSLEAKSGAQLENVQLVIEGASAVSSTLESLNISTPLGDYVLPLPELLQSDVADIQNSQLNTAVTELPDHVFQIEKPFADSQQLLPLGSSLNGAEDLIFSTFLGGTAADSVYGLDVNSLQEVFTTGKTISTDFPTTPGVFDPDVNNEDAFVVRFNKYGNGIIYATYIGGYRSDEANGIALDGNTAYITGSTYSDDFPLAGPRYSESFDAFVAALNGTGTNLIYANLHGGEADDFGYGIDVESGMAHITGTTWSKDIPGAAAPAKMRGYAAKFDASGNRLYGIVFGGRGQDAAYAIKVSGGSAYITGESDSFDLGPGGSFIVEVDDTYVIKFSSTGEKVFARMIGGSLFDRGNGIAVDSSGRAIIVGTTESLNFPVTADSNAGGYDGFMAVLNAAGTAWDFVSLIGGEGFDSVTAVSLDSSGGIQIVGRTSSENFPTTTDAYQPALAGGEDAFVARYDLLGDDPGYRAYSSLLGGSGSDQAKSIANDAWGYTYLGGVTGSPNFPVTFGSFDTNLSGSQDGFVAKMAVGPVPGIYLEASTNGADADSPPGPHILYGSMVNWTYWIANTGPLSLTEVAVTDNMGVTVTCPKNYLNQGESMTCTASGTAIVGQYNNIGSVSAHPPGGLPPVTASDPSHYFGAQPSIQIIKKTNGVNSDTPPGPNLLVGATVEWTYEVANTGNVSLTNVVVTDSDATLTVTCPTTTLAAFGLPNSTMVCASTGTAVGGNYQNTATVTAKPPDDLAPVTDSDVDHYHGVGPDVQITKDISLDGGNTWLNADALPEPTLLSGYAPKFKITVTNNGDVPIANIQVTDSVHSLSSCTFGSTLSVGVSKVCTISPPWTAGSHLSTASVTADYTDSSNNTVQVSDANSACYFGVQVGVDVLKEISLDNQLTWQDANVPPGATLLNNGTAPKYRITVHNTSNVALNVNLSDSLYPLPGGCASGILQLDDGTPNAGSDQRICLVTGAWIAGPRSNTATTSLTFTDGGGHTANLSDTDKAHYFGANPNLTLTLEISLNNGATWLDGNTTPEPTLLSGVNPQFRMTLHNSGNVQIENILITDPDLALSGCDAPLTLAPAASKICSAIGTWAAGHQTVNVSSSALFVDSTGAQWTSNLAKAAHYFGADPHLSVVKDVSVDGGSTWLPADTAPGPSLLSGQDQPRFRLTLTNTGNVSLLATMTDSEHSLPAECANGSLAPSASRQCTNTDVWTAGGNQNTASGSAAFTDTAGTSRNVSDTDDAFYFGAQPLINLEKFVSGDNGVTWNDADSTPGPYFLQSSILKYKLVLDNIGNMPVTNPAWSDPGFNLAGCPLLPATFTPEAAAVECVILGSWSAGQNSNLASASAAYTDTGGHVVSPSDNDAAHYFGALPGVSIVKSTNGEDANAAPGPNILVGDPVEWTYVITNTGNVPITGIAVTDDNGTPLNLSDDFAAVCGSTNLSAGGTQTCTASGAAVIGAYVNNASVTTQPKIGTTPIGPPLTDSDVSHYFGANISYTLEKTTNNVILDNNSPGPFVEIGKNVTWRFKVTNTGNIPLTNVKVYDDNGTPVNTSDDRLVCTITAIQPEGFNLPDSCKFTGAARAGQYSNVGRAEVVMLDKEFTEYDFGHYYGYDPDQILDMTVKLNSIANGGPPGIFLPVNEDLHFLYTVYNSSPSEMTIVALTDDSGTPEDPSDDVTFCQNSTVPTWATFVCPRPLTQALAGQHTHTGHVSTLADFNPLTHDASSSYFGVSGGITLDVHTNGQDPAAALDLLIQVGDPVVWEYFIENTSNILLSQIHLVDPTGTAIPCPAADLAIGAAMTCTVNGTAQPGAFQNDAHVSGGWPDDVQASYSDTVSYYFGVQAGLSLEFKLNGLPADVSPGGEWFIGDTVELTYEITNTGNFLLDNISVSDSVSNAITCPGQTLAAGTSMTCTAEEQVAPGIQERIATVNGTVNDNPLSATAPIYYTGVPKTYEMFLPLILR